MALTEPPGPQRLRGLPRWRLAGRRLWCVYRTVRDAPWRFASLTEPAADSGRFDLPPPDGASYRVRSKLAAPLEALQGFGRGLLPVSELAA